MMENLASWLRSGENALNSAQLFAALVTALATFALWRATQALRKETALLAELTSQPFVVCSIESSAAYAEAQNLMLRNTGNATAFDIEFRMTPDLPLKEKPVEGTEIRRVVSVLPPGQKLPLKGTESPEIDEVTFHVELSWASLPGGKDRKTLAYSIRALDGFRAGFQEKTIHHIAEEVKKIREYVARKGKP